MIKRPAGAAEACCGPDELEANVAKKATKPNDDGLSKPMPGLQGKAHQMLINGCVVYHNPNLRSWRIRVAAHVGCRYTKCFGWGGDPGAQWAKVLQYCTEKPDPPY